MIKLIMENLKILFNDKISEKTKKLILLKYEEFVSKQLNNTEIVNKIKEIDNIVYKEIEILITSNINNTDGTKKILKIIIKEIKKFDNSIKCHLFNIIVLTLKEINIIININIYNKDVSDNIDKIINKIKNIFYDKILELKCDCMDKNKILQNIVQIKKGCGCNNK